MAWRGLNIITTLILILILSDVILQTRFHPLPPPPPPPPLPGRQLFTDDGNQKIKSMSWELIILYITLLH